MYVGVNRHKLRMSTAQSESFVSILGLGPQSKRKKKKKGRRLMQND